MRRLYLLLLGLLLVLVCCPGFCDTAELEQHLKDQYQGKIFVLRGFYSGDRLRYKSSGDLSHKAPSGDWTVDGIVQIKEVHISKQNLKIETERILVTGKNGAFSLRTQNAGERKMLRLDIESELGKEDIAPAQVDSAMSKIFLTEQDDLSNLLPDYWKPCVLLALTGREGICKFSPDFPAIPGIESHPKNPNDTTTKAARSMQMFGMAPWSNGGISPPKVVFAPEPRYDERAREERIQGESQLVIVVDEQGVPKNIRVLSPLGCGLDAKAVEDVAAWKFKPAEKNGQKVAVEVSVKVGFRLD